MHSDLVPDPFPAEDFRATSSAHSQLAGVLGGFCFTILVLVLSPDFLQGNRAVKDWVLGLLLLSSVSYVFASSLLANAMNALVLKTVTDRCRVFYIGMLISSAAHVLLAITLTILVYQFSSTVGTIAAVAIVFFVLFNAYMNARVEFRIFRRR